MHKFFEVAILVTIAVTFMNGTLVSLGPVLFETDFVDLSGTDLYIDSDEVKALSQAEENSAKSGDPVEQITAFISGLLSPVTGSVGGVWLMLNVLFSFATAYDKVLGAVFGGIPLLYCNQVCVLEGKPLGFLQMTLIPIINLLQLSSIVYLFAYIVGVVRRGNA